MLECWTAMALPQITDTGRQDSTCLTFFIYYLGNSQSNCVFKVCLTVMKDGNTMTQHKHCCLPSSYLHAVLSVFYAEALQILAGHRLFTVVSGIIISGRKKIPISYIGLQNRMKTFTSFNRQNCSFSLNGTSCLQLIPQVSSGEEALLPVSLQIVWFPNWRGWCVQPL